MFPLAAERRATAKPAKSAVADGLSARAPRLREAGERVVGSIVKSLQTMAGPATTIEGMLAALATDKARAVIAAHSAESVAGSIVLKDLSASILATLDATLVHAIVELLCGGNGVEAPSVEPRPVTQIDQQFAQIVFTLAASAIQSEWAEFGIESARAAKIEGPLSADMFGARVEEIGVLNVTLGIFGLHGTLRLVLPPALLGRFGGTPDQPVVADTPDPSWTNMLHQELGRAPVALAAYLDAKDIPLSSLAGLKVGQILALPTNASTRASLMSDGRVLYRGEIGQDNSHYSLRIDEIVGEPASVARMAARRTPYFDTFKA